MSWDTQVIERPCACGKGTFVLTLRSNDWGSSEESGVTKCDRCSEEFEFKVWKKHDGDTSFGWVKRLSPEEVSRRKREDDERLHREAVTLKTLRHELGNHLVEALSRFTSRKKLWEFIQESRLTTESVWSFAEFNRLVVAGGRAAAITELITPETEKAVRVLLQQSK